jgi:uncharacterized small protein (DUF1192 family)
LTGAVFAQTGSGEFKGTFSFRMNGPTTPATAPVAKPAPKPVTPLKPATLPITADQLGAILAASRAPAPVITFTVPDTSIALVKVAELQTASAERIAVLQAEIAREKIRSDERIAETQAAAARFAATQTHESVIATLDAQARLEEKSRGAWWERLLNTRAMNGSVASVGLGYGLRGVRITSSSVASPQVEANAVGGQGGSATSSATGGNANATGGSANATGGNATGGQGGNGYGGQGGAGGTGGQGGQGGAGGAGGQGGTVVNPPNGTTPTVPVCIRWVTTAGGMEFRCAEWK